MRRAGRNTCLFGSRSVGVLTRVSSLLSSNTADLGVRKHSGDTCCVTTVAGTCGATISTCVIRHNFRSRSNAILGPFRSHIVHPSSPSCNGPRAASLVVRRTSNTFTKGPSVTAIPITSTNRPSSLDCRTHDAEHGSGATTRVLPRN